MKSFALVIFIFYSIAAHSNCVISEREERNYRLECANYLGQTTLYDREGKEFIVLSHDDQAVFVDGSEDEFAIGELLYLNPPLKTIENKPIAIELDSQKISTQESVFDPMSANHYRLFLTGMSYEHQSVSADFSFINRSYETSRNKFKTLPLSFNLELTFDSFGMMFIPDFDEKTGEIVIYKTFDSLSFGAFLSVSSDGTTTTVKSGNTIVQDEDNALARFIGGVYVRFEHDLNEHWSFFGEVRSGYYRESEESFNAVNNKSAEVLLEGGVSIIEPYMYYKVSKNFRFGFGARVMLGVGVMSIEENSSTVSDNVFFSNVSLFPLRMQLLF